MYIYCTTTASQTTAEHSFMFQQKQKERLLTDASAWMTKNKSHTNCIREIKTKIFCISCWKKAVTTQLQGHNYSDCHFGWQNQMRRVRTDTDEHINTHTHTYLSVSNPSKKEQHSHEKSWEKFLRESSWIITCISMLAQSLTVCHVNCANLSWYKGLEHRGTEDVKVHTESRNTLINIC